MHIIINVKLVVVKRRINLSEKFQQLYSAENNTKYVNVLAQFHYSAIQ